MGNNFYVNSITTGEKILNVTLSIVLNRTTQFSNGRVKSAENFVWKKKKNSIELICFDLINYSTFYSSNEYSKTWFDVASFNLHNKCISA